MGKKKSFESQITFEINHRSYKPNLPRGKEPFVVPEIKRETMPTSAATPDIETYGHAFGSDLLYRLSEQSQN